MINSPALRFSFALLLAAVTCLARAGDVEQRHATIFSEGARLQATVYAPKSSTLPRPTIIMAPGWGGTAAMLEPQATDLARAGYLVVAFDFRGWGQSEARVVRTADEADQAEPTRALREVVDPLDQALDMHNVVHWAMGEPAVDRDRLGLWGTSFSGGLVVYVAARDPRVRALVSQVGYMGQPLASAPAASLQKSYEDATRRARGQLGCPAAGIREIGNLTGAPIREKFLLYAPVDDVARAVNCATLFIAAEREELFDNRQHPQLAFERARGPKKYVVIPDIAHYGIYGPARDAATKLAIDWFDQHLKK